MNVERNVFFCCVCAVFLDGGRFLRLCLLCVRFRMLLRRGRLFGHGLLNRRFVLRLVRLRFFRDHLRRLRLRIVERVCEFLHRLRSLLHGIDRLHRIAAGREAQKQRQQKQQRE